MNLLPCVERATGPDPACSVLWLHGLGADGNDFLPLVPELVEADWPALRFVFPHAPERPVSINGGLRMCAWYDLYGMDLAHREDAEGIRDSILAVQALIAREVERGVPEHRLILAGFSQGGAIALACALRHPRPLAGIVALSTYLPLADDTPAEASTANLDTPIFQAHGRGDPVVPEALGQRTRQRLEQLGCRPEWHDYPMGHQVCPEEIADLRVFMRARLLA